MIKTLKSARLASLLAALAVIIVLHQSGTLDGFQNVISESRMSSTPRNASGETVFIAIDKKSLDAVGVWPWPRSIYATAIEKLVEAQAGDIAVDVDFSTPSKTEEDQALAAALEAAGGSVILPIFLQTEGVGEASRTLVRSKPVASFADHAWMAGVNVIPDIDGVVRHYMNGLEIDGEMIPSFASMLSRREELDATSFRVDFSIRPESIPAYSFADLIAGQIPREQLTDKSILIGAHALELRDTLVVPVHGAIPGPVLQLLAAETRIQDRLVSRTTLLTTHGVLVFLAMLTILFMPRIGLRFQFGCILALALGIEVLGLVMFDSWAIMLVSAPLQVLLLLSAVAHAAMDSDLKAWLLQLARQDWRNTKDVLDQVFNDSSDAFLVIGEDDKVIEINERFYDLFGLSPDSVIGLNEGSVLPDSLVSEARKAFLSSQAAKPATERHVISLPLGQDERYIEFSVTPSRMETIGTAQFGDTDIQTLVCIAARDVTVERKQRLELEQLSKFDPLTGAERRNLLLKRLQESITGNESKGRTTTLLGIGIRRLKAVNGTLGRGVGDEFLKSVVDRLSQIDKRVAGIARLDGDLFAVRLIGEQVGATAVELCDRIERELSVPFRLAQQNIRAQVYVGMASSGGDRRRTAKQLVDDLEFALETARSSGSNRAEYDPKLDEKHSRSRLIETEIDGALQGDQFHLLYQPQVRAVDGQPVGAEALMRWEHPRLGTISPVEFIEIAEATGRMEALGRFALNKACIEAKSWPEHTWVSVNVSPVQFARGSVLRDVREALRLSGLPAHRLELEITESCFMNSDEDLIADLNALKDLGVSIALDDFGTGYSSLNYFSIFPVDKVKVDQAFVRDVDRDKVNGTILEAIGVLAKGLGLVVLCEGVETERELDIVRGLGCQEIQGYYFSKPLDASAISTWFARAAKSAA